jgi:hypothetical protein
MGWLFTAQAQTQASGHCGNCSHFRNDPAFLEATFKGLTSFSSAHASVRGDDGLCTRHDRYIGARSFCGDFTAAD